MITPPKIAIVGAGPAGCTLAILLKQHNIDCVVYDDGMKPDLIVGESLVSAVIPILRKLGVENQVAAIATLKYGAALRHPNGARVDFRFQEFGKQYPAYSYNIPRPEFDQVLFTHAQSLGVHFVSHRAKLQVVDDDPMRDLQLCDESLHAAGLTRDTQPELLIDATGRSRLFSRTLKVPTQKGTRNDVSYFAHYRNFNADGIIPGQVVLSVLDCGWSWQIPVKDVLSVGVVLDKQAAKHYGNSAEERLENAIDANSLLQRSGHQRQRVTEVKSYSNYQLISKRGFGKGWVLLGDAHGFVDPMLSPGVFMGMESAMLLNKVITRYHHHHQPFHQIAKQELNHYCSTIQQWHEAWDTLINYFYDGRLLSLANIRQQIQESAGRFSLPRLVEPRISRILSSLVSGIKTRSAFNQAVLKYSCEYMLKNDAESIQHHAINSQSNAAKQAMSQ